MIVAIDGPAGSGKSTLAKLLAKKLDFLFVDTGAMYRALTWRAIQNKIDVKDEKKLVALLKEIEISLVVNNNECSLKVFVDGQDVSEAIREPFVTNQVKFIASLKQVREEMVKKQRVLAKDKDVVLEGRDIGTVVFPEADYKFYLDASLDTRSRRRYQDLAAAGYKTQLEDLKNEIEQRDKSDFERKVAPLKQAQDAHYIDTTKMGITEVCDEILKVIQSGKQK